MGIPLALVGLGDHMYSRLYPLLAPLDVDLVAVCDRDASRLARFAGRYAARRQYADFETMLDEAEPAAVICAGPAGLHYAVARACMLRGISPFVEKTPCETAAQALELCALEKKTGCFTMTGFNRRFATAYMMAREIVSSPEFGTPLLYMAKYNASPYASQKYFFFNHVIHHLDTARFFMGEITSISADKRVLNDREVCCHIRFSTAAGAMGFLQSASVGCEAYPMERVEITGRAGNVIVDNVKQVEYNRSTDARQGPDPAPLGQETDCLRWNMNHGHSSLYGHYGFERELGVYLACVAEGKRPPLTFADTAQTMLLYEQLMQNTLEVKVEACNFPS